MYSQYLTSFISQILLSAAGGILTLVGSWYFLREDIRKLLLKPPVEKAKDDQTQLLALRLQAHERMIVFVDRLNPTNLFLRLHEQGMSAHVLQSIILNEIRSEFQHNVSQQLYISAASWTVVRKLKEDTIAMINNAVGGLPVEATGRDLSRKVLEHMAGIADNPYDLTLELIKQDIHQLF